ncbi:hypothetical protein BpHYR1_004272 [Brachionus plicatilis]|uniref:Uncharacterized protein n=1 Tax=Brachionus plicatilis TaxID=10195 RepID=A0A3M7QQG9_BRAPC|nr:hypothetical protein BpHYR1_004272 [Brachionus plicatilis]
MFNSYSSFSGQSAYGNASFGGQSAYGNTSFGGQSFRGFSSGGCSVFYVREVPETEIEKDHKNIISRQEFLNMIKQQRDFLLAEDNQNRDLLKKLQEIETSIMKNVKQQKISNYFVKH